MFDFDEDIDFGAADSPAIYGYTSLRTDFHAINYKTDLSLRLEPRRVIEFGNILKVEYLDPATDEVVVREDYVYKYQVPDNVASFPVVRTITITWFNRDGTENGRTKKLVKNYDLDARILAALKRRTTLVRRLETEIFGILYTVFQGDLQATAAEAKRFRSSISPEVRAFIDDADDEALREAFINDTAATWLDTPILAGLTARQIVVTRIK